MYEPAFFNNTLYLSILDQGYEICDVFLDFSKTFNKVWHKGLVHKLEQNGIDGYLLKILTDFFKSRKQRFVPNGQHSSWSDVLATRINPCPPFVSYLYQ